jgi:hypothetical protein
MPNACHHQAAEGCNHRGYPLVAALVNGIVSGHLCGPASTLGGVRDEQVQRQLFHFHPVDTGRVPLRGVNPEARMP